MPAEVTVPTTPALALALRDEGGPGVHRHAVTVMLASSFLVWLEWRQRHGPRGRGRPHDPFSPRPDRRRRTLPAIHREVARWLRHQAVQWWVTTDRFIDLRSRRL
jgi:hypothetical protein